MTARDCCDERDRDRCRDRGAAAQADGSVDITVAGRGTRTKQTPPFALTAVDVLATQLQVEPSSERGFDYAGIGRRMRWRVAANRMNHRARSTRCRRGYCDRGESRG